MRRGETVEWTANTCTLAVMPSQVYQLVLLSVDGNVYPLELQHALDLSSMLNHAVIAILQDNAGPHEGGQR